MDVRQQRAVRNATARVAKATAELARLTAAAGVQQSVDDVLTALNHYRRFRICIFWCVLIAIIPLFLLLGMISPLGPGYYVVMTQFAYWPHFIGWSLGWFGLAAMFDRIK